MCVSAQQEAPSYLTGLLLACSFSLTDGQELNRQTPVDNILFVSCWLHGYWSCGVLDRFWAGWDEGLTRSAPVIPTKNKQSKSEEEIQGCFAQVEMTWV